jgi:hypothetical protein
VRRINWVKGIIPLLVNISSKLRFPHENRLYKKHAFLLLYTYVILSRVHCRHEQEKEHFLFLSKEPSEQLLLSLSRFSADDCAASKEYYRDKNGFLSSESCKKNSTVAVFPSPAGMSLIKLSNSPWPGIFKLFPAARESLVSDIPAGDKKIATFFTVSNFAWDPCGYLLSPNL